MGEDATACKNVGVCTTHVIWQRIYDGFNNVIHSITLQDMLDDYNRLGETRPDAKDVRCLYMGIYLGSCGNDIYG